MNEAQIKQRHHQLEIKEDIENNERGFLNLKLDEKYCILEDLSKRPFCTIYKGINIQTKQQVAIKVFDKKALDTIKNSNERMNRKRLMKEESKIMMKLNNPYILKCYDSYQNDTFKIMIIEYCNQGNLLGKINQEKIIRQEIAINIIQQLINAVAQCHKNKIIHRDIKPQNIFIHDGQYKLADFGFSKQLNISNENELLKNTILGSPTTMAPEVKNRQPYGLKADIWSLGVIFFHMIFGKCPFNQKEKAEQTLTKINEVLLKSSQPEYNKVKPSPKTLKFLSEVLVIDVNKRLGWKQVLQHDLFKQYSQSLVKKKFLRQVKMPQDQSSLFRLENEVKCQSSMISNIQPSKIANFNNLESKLEPITEQKNQQEEPNTQSQRNKSISKDKNYQSNNTDLTCQKKNGKQQRFQNQEQVKPSKKQQIRSEKPQPKVQQLAKSSKQKIQIKQESIQSKKQQKTQVSNKVSHNPLNDPKRQDPTNKSKLKKKQKSFIEEMNQHEITQAQINVNREESIMFKWSQRIHFQCVITQWILKNIIEFIEKEKLLDTSTRQIVQLMYLLCTRCLNNISPINVEYEKRKNTSRVIIDLKNAIQPLRQKVEKKWLAYSKKLTETQNYKISQMSDWFYRWFSKNSYNRKEKFLTGIEDMTEFRPEGWKEKKKRPQNNKEDDLLDYDKHEQISYTEQYINRNLKYIESGDPQKKKKILSYLKCYKKICLIKPQDYKNITLEDYIKKQILA